MEDQLSPMRAEMQGGENVFYDQGSEDPPVEGEEDPFGAAVDEGAGEGGAGAQDDPDAVFDVDGAGAGEVAAAEDDPFGGALDAKDAGDITTMAPPADGPYAKWEEEHKKLLEERLQAAREKKEKNLEEAESALIKFDEKRGADKEKMHEDNLADEKEKRAQIEKLFKSGENDWEKVCKMLSLKADSNRKVDRFRKLLATLKVEGTYAKSKREGKA